MECALEPCTDKGGKFVRLSRKGTERILQCSKVRKDGVHNKFRTGRIEEVHIECRKFYTRNPVPPPGIPQPETAARTTFPFKTNCFICSHPCIDFSKSRNPAKEMWYAVRTIPMIESMRETAVARGDQCPWGKEVLLRLSTVRDLVACEGRYHMNCYSRFKEGSRKPGEGSRGGAKLNAGREAAFENLCRYIEENDECQYTLKELNDTFRSLNPDIELYSEKQLKNKLITRYGDKIHLSQVAGKSGIICFSETASTILTDAWYQSRKMDVTEEEMRIVKTAAEIIRRDIKSQMYDFSLFPTTQEIRSGGKNLVPESLSLLLNIVTKPTKQTQHKKKVIERKNTSIAHSIISVARPRSFVSPVLFGMAVTFHRRFGSRLLIDILANMGFSAQYNEVLAFERSVTSEDRVKIDHGYVQFVFDNADYNVHTLDGHGSFHAMGGILCVTPRSALTVNTQVPRQNISARAVESSGLTKLHIYQRPDVSGYCNTTALGIRALRITPVSVVDSRILNLFWCAGLWIQGLESRPGWGGFMEECFATESFETTAVLPLPFVNLAPSNPSTIYTALQYAAQEGARYGQRTTMVTFDQPLYAKAHEMIASAPSGSALKSLFIRLGGFHLLLSFLGSIGHIMGGSGLDELWSQVYAKNSVVKMLSGKAYARAVRALYLTEEALLTVFLDTQNTLESSQHLKTEYSSFIKGGKKPEELTKNPVIKNFIQQLEKQLTNAAASGRTQRLWIQLIELIEIVRMFVRAERCGDFYLHLHCVERMLPYFHASGHLNYAKSAHIYLQDCLLLLSTLSEDEFGKFISKGFFTIRRSEKNWCGTWSDMTIEQFLMKALKSSGGLTRGRGISASTIATWVNSMHACSAIVEALEEFVGVDSSTSEQHADLRESCKHRNLKDLGRFISWLREHNPFIKPPELSSLSTGVLADESVNCDAALDCGLAAIKEVEGKRFIELHLKRKFTVKTLAGITKSVNIRNESVCVNPNQLLHRMVCVVRTEEQIAEIFGYELCSYPPSLFDEGGLMRKGTKSSILSVFHCDTREQPTSSKMSQVSCVIDGGHLLHRVVWQRPATFKVVCRQIVGYVVTHYGKAKVVFDGYGGENNTKDEEHRRRSSTARHVDVNVEDSIEITCGQADFLSNEKNKMQFISLLRSYLQKEGCETYQADGDADVLVVNTAIAEATKGIETVLIGDDTDLLVLLIALAPPIEHLKMVVPGRNNQPDKIHNVFAIQKQLDEMTKVLLPVYAFTGCDTVSSIFRKGKVSPFQKLKMNKELRERLEIFNEPHASPVAVANVGEALFLFLYGSKGNETLDTLRHKLYMKTIAKQPIHAQFNLSVLPPTTAAAREHSFRVFHQVMLWKSVNLDPLKWGWKKSGGRLCPKPTTKAAAPDQLLCLISCSCTDGCGGKCECLRSALKCSTICINCAGHGCTNKDAADELDEEDLWTSDQIQSAEVDEPLETDAEIDCTDPP